MSFLKKTPYTFDSIVRSLISLFLLISLIFTLRVLRVVLLPFAAAIILSYLINPFISFIQSKSKFINRTSAVIIGLSIITITFFSIGYVSLPLITTEIQETILLLRKHALNSTLLSVLSPELESAIRTFLKSENYTDMIDLNIIQRIWSKYTPRALDFFHHSVSLLTISSALITTALYIIFILIDYTSVINTTKELIPFEYRKSLITVVLDLKKSMNTYFRAQASIALIVGILFSIGFKLINLPFGITLGLFIGLLNIVPYLQIVGLIPAFFLAYLQALESNESIWYILIFVCAIFIIVQLIQELVLIPQIMKNATGMNPAFILLSLSIWGTLLGFLGLLIALPITSVSIAYYKRYIDRNN